MKTSLTNAPHRLLSRHWRQILVLAIASLLAGGGGLPCNVLAGEQTDGGAAVGAPAGRVKQKQAERKKEKLRREDDKQPVVEETRPEAPPPPIKDPGELGRRNYERLLDAVAWIVIDPSDDWRNDGWGSGWLVDRDRRLLVTNHHVADVDGAIAEPDGFCVFFPEYRDGEVITDRAWYYQHGQRYTGKVIDSDPRRDLAVIQLDSLPKKIEPLPLAPASVKPGDRLYSMGNPGASDAAWVYTMGSVRQVYQKRFLMTGGQQCDYRAVETQSPTNSGDSGGPVINDAGQLAAVCSAGSDDANLMEVFVDVSEVRGFLDEVLPMLTPKTASDYNERGVRYYERGRYDLALADFTEASRLDPELADAIGNRGWTFYQKDDLDTAIADFDEAIKLNDKDANYFEGRGRAYLEKQAYDSAAADFTQAIRLAPGSDTLYAARGDVYFAEEDYDKAAVDYGQAIRLSPQDPDYYNSRGVCYSRAERHKEAIPDLTHAIELDPNNAVYYHNRAVAYRGLEDTTSADWDYWRMERVDPDYAAEQLETYYRRYLKITNAGSETIYVWVKYHTRTDKGQWKWFPGEPDDGRWAIYKFAPGESSYLNDDGFRINADRVRIWAGNSKSASDWKSATVVWSQFEKQDLVLVGDEGERSYYMRTHESTFK